MPKFHFQRQKIDVIIIGSFSTLQANSTVSVECLTNQNAVVLHCVRHDNVLRILAQLSGNVLRKLRQSIHDFRCGDSSRHAINMQRTSLKLAL